MDIESMNVLMAIPYETVYIKAKAQFMSDDGIQEASAIYSPRDIHRAFHEFYVCQEGYFPDHKDMIPDDAEEYPIIFQLPDGACGADLLFACINDSGEETFIKERHLKFSDIKKMRAEFLKYIPDGDSYNDEYYLTPEFLEKVKALSEEEFNELLKEGAV